MHIAMTPPRRLRLGEILVQQQVITQEQLDEALEIQKNTGDRLGEILCQKGYATEEQICYHLARQLGVPYMSLQTQVLPVDVVQLIPREIAVKQNVIAIDKLGRFITIAMADPLDQAAREQIAQITGFKVQFVVSTSQEIQEAIERYYRPDPQAEGSPEEETPEPEEQEREVPESPDAPPGVHVLDMEDAQIADLEEAPPPNAPQESAPSPQRTVSRPSQRIPTDPVRETALSDLLSPDWTLATFVFPDESPLAKAVEHLCYASELSWPQLVIEGAVGMGKTHLLHAIGNALTRRTPPRRVEYLDAREILLRLEEGHVHHQLCQEICQELGQSQLALLDNWHLLAQDNSSQMLAAIVMDHLFASHVHIVCALCPCETWDPALESRLTSGLYLHLSMPDAAKRFEILKIQEDRLAGPALPEVLLKELATPVPPNIRALIASWRLQRFELASLSH